MSSPLAIAVVTAVLKDLLNNGLIDNDTAAIGSVTVSALPPDRIATGEAEGNRLNLFLYQVTPNLGWRNQDLPSHGPGGERRSNPPLALDLHYLVTAYGQDDLAAEILLGYAMDILHQTRVLHRGAIRRALSPANPINVNLIPADTQGRVAADLADQIEQVKIAPHFLQSDELARFWSAMQSRYRVSMAYQVSTVLIQSRLPAAAALPVLRRGEEDRGINGQPGLDQPAANWPALNAVTVLDAADHRRVAAELGDRLVFEGSLLSGDQITAEFRHPKLSDPLERAGDASVPGQVSVQLPTGAAASLLWPAGNYAVVLRLERAGKATRWTNALNILLVPRLSKVELQGPPQAPVLKIQLQPAIWPGQRVELLVGGEPLAVPKINAKTEDLSIPLTGITAADELLPVRLRVDGAESLLVRDPTAQPPVFDPLQSVSLPGGHP
ncbi:DUF4255 domain-containing protein [Ensifer sp.]|jgi:hypothetical protein|uniref:DUF4255 domain-containing protein n=1 Tax=Ensifer sp. TaxID=1872086 RepID=UPI002E127D11|nr:DUF4255 domain-containing protein [Ensifer sp.]